MTGSVDADKDASAARNEANERWLEATLRLDTWMRERDFAGYDPHDFLNSPWVRALTLGNRWLAVAWTQLGRRSAIQLRPALGVRPHRNAKGIGLVLAAHLRLAQATGGPTGLEEESVSGGGATPTTSVVPGPDEASYYRSAHTLARWLGANRSATPHGAGWGYPFPWANRDFYAPAHTPSSVATAFIGHALLDLVTVMETSGTDRPSDGMDAKDAGGPGPREILDWVDEACAFIQRDLARVPGATGTFCFSYTPLDRRAVHNANLLAASLLARLAGRVGETETEQALAEDALRATRFSVAAQRADGSWLYGLGARNAWVDSFHTGYVLVALKRISESLGTTEFEGALEAGTQYWMSAFFNGPAVGFYTNSPYPIDLHAVAHAILALLELRDRIPGAIARAERLAEWALEEMRDADGYFYYRRGRYLRNRLPYMRWIQAWMLRALAELAVVRRGHTATERGAPVALGNAMTQRHSATVRER